MLNNTLKVLRESLSFSLVVIAVVFVVYRNAQNDAGEATDHSHNDV